MPPQKRDQYPTNKAQKITRDADLKPGKKTAERPGVSAAISCNGKGSRGSCPSNQACVSKRNVLTSEAVQSKCVGQTCFLAARQEDKRVRCPSGQVCVAKPRRDGVQITDVPGLCADKEMACKVSTGCGHMGKDWMCQSRPNGDGAVCKGTGCGLCIHYGDGKLS